jgi:hypothetical protein
MMSKEPRAAIVRQFVVGDDLDAGQQERDRRKPEEGRQVASIR